MTTGTEMKKEKREKKVYTKLVTDTDEWLCLYGSIMWRIIEISLNFSPPTTQPQHRQMPDGEYFRKQEEERHTAIAVSGFYVVGEWLSKVIKLW